MTRVGNQTNSTDPAAVNSRIFVGNLNTHVVSKEDLERLFKKYGKIIGISMHKGYAFVQFTDTYDARNAILGEDGRTVAGQILDVNMVSEPKPHQVVTRKRLNLAPDPFSGAVAAQSPLITAGFPPTILPPVTQSTPMGTAVQQVTHLRHSLASPVKRARTESSGNYARKKTGLNGLKSSSGKIQPIIQIQGTTDSDILICGTCREVFPTLQKLMEHKRQRCRLRFTCRCQPNSITGDSPDCPAPVCAQCLYRCASWWQLVCHMESTHGLTLYQHSVPNNLLLNNNNNSVNAALHSANESEDGDTNGGSNPEEMSEDSNDHQTDNLEKHATSSDAGSCEQAVDTADHTMEQLKEQEMLVPINGTEQTA